MEPLSEAPPIVPHNPGLVNMPNTPQRALRVPDDVWAAAKAAAETEGRTLTDVIVRYLRRYGRRAR